MIYKPIVASGVIYLCLFIFMLYKVTSTDLCILLTITVEDSYSKKRMETISSDCYVIYILLYTLPIVR